MGWFSQKLLMRLIKFLNLFGLGLGVELQVRPKSGLSKRGIDVELGTVDEGYRGYVGATVTNNSKSTVSFKVGNKLAQLVPTLVFNDVKLIKGKFDDKTDRGAGGFGSTGN